MFPFDSSAKPKAIVPKFSLEQKEMLSNNISALTPENLQRMVELLSQEIPQSVKNGQIEIDLEQLSDVTLAKLNAFVNGCIQSQQQQQQQLPSQNQKSANGEMKGLKEGIAQSGVNGNGKSQSGDNADDSSSSSSDSSSSSSDSDSGDDSDKKNPS